ncbi:LPXTG cell wall anchor domain-containing protein [Arthrobacter sp. Sa2CUA1]|uniref:LPXTG cell wall anchor domain-containing protein n=1 Tax=Arthrobacter gallicola TaxID=2762225 RepID=A0ABR8UU66_9MICC|nr:LPXTG cell wall anchor domain-containing protein [Arthrobacter gallicola]MBD7996074.1 LPXTG cell wall anchor domain-containing protein [Arthrobacter gallicola]
MKKAASALVLTGALTFLGAGAATAVDANYPAPPAAVTGTVSAAVVAPGGTVTFSGTGFNSGEIIDVTVDYDNDPNVVAGTGVNGLIILNQRVAAYTDTAGTDGTFSTQVTLGEEGTYTLTAVGRDNGRTVTATVVVDKSAAAGAGNNSGTNNAGKSELADTGADNGMLLWGAAGVLALGAGAVTLGVARRKKA